MIEPDEPSTFPHVIREWVINRKDYFIQKVSANYQKNDIKIALEDMYLYDMPGFKELLCKYGCAGSKRGSVSPNDILQIDVIDYFTKVVSKNSIF